NYRVLKDRLKNEGKGWVLMPLIPWDPVLDSDDLQTMELVERDGKLYKPGEDQPYSGRAVKYYKDSEQKHTDMRVRRGLPEGEWLGYNREGALALKAFYHEGQKQREEFTGEMPPQE